MHKRSRARCFTGIMLLLLLLVWPTTPVAQAHALLVRSSPAAGAELAIAPATLDLWFSEPLEANFSYAYLVDSLGNELGRDGSTVDGADPYHLTLTPPPLSPGIYTVVYHSLSQSDGHEWLGSFPITILNADGSRPTGVTAGTAPVDDVQLATLPLLLKVASRWFSLFGVMLLVGVVCFQRFVIGHDRSQPAAAMPATTTSLLTTFDQHSRWAIIGGIGAVFIGGWLQVLAQMVTLGAMAGRSGATLDLFFQTRVGMLIVARQLLVGALLLLTIVASSVSVMLRTALQWVALALTLALSATFAVGSHAAAVVGSGWAILGDFVHLVAAGAWFGGLALLATVLWQWRTQPAADAILLQRVVGRFSMLATLAVFVLCGTGVFSALIHLETVDALWRTTYGWLLLVKLLLVLATLGLAFRNHRLVRQQATTLWATTWTATHYPTFARQVWGESGLALGLLVVVAILVQTPVPPPAAPAPAAFFETTFQADDLTIHLQISPNQVGDNRYIAHLAHADGTPIGEVQLVRLTFVHQTAGQGQATLELAAQGGDLFAGRGAYQNRAGPWDVRLYVRRRGLDDLLAQTTVTVPPPVPSPAATLWQNPIPTIASAEVALAVLIALGLLPLIWAYLARRERPDRTSLL